MVVDEPFYAHYLKKSGKKHPLSEEVLTSQSADYSTVVSQLLSPSEKPHLFIKNMAHHIPDQDGSWMGNCTNVIFIRDPARVLNSFSKVVRFPSLEDIAIKFQWDLMSYFEKNNMRFVIVDSKDLLQNPEVFLKKLCLTLGIDFLPSMLSWPSGPKPFDGVWGEFWYKAVWASSTFRPYEDTPVRLNPEINKVYKEAMPLYLDLFQKRLTL